MINRWLQNKHSSIDSNFKQLKRVAPEVNAFTCQFPDHILNEIRQVYIKEIKPFLSQDKHRYLFKGGQLFTQTIGEHYIRTYDDKPLLWISCNSDETYQLYQRFFYELKLEYDLKQLIDTTKQIRMYCGFLVVGNHSDSESFHMDYYPGANAYTLITPLFELEPTHGQLLYENNKRKVNTYPYQLNEAIILGDRFYHSTQPYPFNNKLRILLSLTFGSDKMDYWHITKCTLENQSTYLILPCGHQSGACECFIKQFQ